MLYFVQAFSIMDFLGESQRLYPVLPLYNSLLRSCTKIQNIIQASKCLDLMEKQMIGKSEVTYIELLKVCIESAISFCYWFSRGKISLFLGKALCVRNDVIFDRLGSIWFSFAVLVSIFCFQLLVISTKSQTCFHFVIKTENRKCKQKICFLKSNGPLINLKDLSCVWICDSM